MNVWLGAEQTPTHRRVKRVSNRSALDGGVWPSPIRDSPRIVVTTMDRGIVCDLVASVQAPRTSGLNLIHYLKFNLSSSGENKMRALVLLIVFLVGCSTFEQQPKEITNSIGMKLVLIPAGTFTMGSPMKEVGRSLSETPHEVTISKSCYLGTNEVTQGQYEKVMGDNPSEFKGEENPVDSVNWEEAVSFCQKLSEMPEEKAAGREYRLPTEAEWEYACRAGSTTSYSFGETEKSLEEYAWFGGNSGDMTHPVGEKKPNRWGLYDMHGNVLEWCQDWYADGPPDASTDPQGPNRGLTRVLRGGSWGGNRGGSWRFDHPGAVRIVAAGPLDWESHSKTFAKTSKSSSSFLFVPKPWFAQDFRIFGKSLRLSCNSILAGAASSRALRSPL